MQSVSYGYTIIEVMIVLAVSSFLIFLSSFFLHDREGVASFSVSMQDVQSKVEDWINDSATGFAGAPNTEINCHKGGGQPKIDDGSPNNHADCIFLGKAIQFTDGSSLPTTDQDRMVYAYSVFGLRTFDPGGGLDDRLVADLTEASPAAATGPATGNGSKNLTEDYRLTGTSKVLKICSDGNCASGSRLAGFYLSFNQVAQNKSGSADVVGYQYDLSSNAKPAVQDGNNGAVTSCIEMNGSCSTPPPNLRDWQICFGNDANDDKAVLSVTSATGTGVSTNLRFVDTCP